jgi:hypothetical protein
MAARTLSTTWKQMEKLAEKLFQKKPQKGALEAIDDLCRKTNESRIVDAMVSLLVTPYGGLDGTKILFAASDGKAFPEWLTDYNAETKTIQVNGVGILKFAAECRATGKTLATPAAKESFQGYRLLSFMAEIGKIPTRLILFLIILVQVARCKEICKADKRGGTAAVADSTETEQYQTLLWAFKELEVFYRETTGVALRSEYGILWYESEWIAGK